MGKCNIKAEELAEALDITVNHLVSICVAFDADPNDDWELTQGIHFEWGPYKSRIFSAEGAVEICKYLEENQLERSFLKRWKRWLFQRDRKLKGLMIAKRIEEVSTMKGHLVFKNGRAFLSPRACREVLSLGTRQDVLWRTFQEIQKSAATEKESLEVDVDFFEDDSKPPTGNGMKYHYFSRSGLASVGQRLSNRLTQKHRRIWAEVVSEYAPRALQAIEDLELNRKKLIQNAKEQVRKQAKGYCQLTNCHQSVGKFNLDVHHLFDQETYPQFADMHINLIAISAEHHNHFHRWMGGTHISCTVEDMERFIEEFSSSLFSNGDVAQVMKVQKQLTQAKKSLRAQL